VTLSLQLLGFNYYMALSQQPSRETVPATRPKRPLFRPLVRNLFDLIFSFGLVISMQDKLQEDPIYIGLKLAQI
jgi:hypothetical protein